jgi:hypothetical protein
MKAYTKMNIKLDYYNVMQNALIADFKFINNQPNSNGTVKQLPCAYYNSSVQVSATYF